MQGRIIGNIANLYKVEANNKIYDATARGKFKNQEISPVVGDEVEIEIENEIGIIEEILPRKTYIKRPKIANITQIIYIISTKNPKPDLLLLDKQLVISEFFNIKPIIIINKIDLSDGYKEVEEVYKKIGYEVIITCAKEKVGIDKIKEVLKGNTSVFSGNSGVGKSSIINCIFSEKITQEGEISLKNKKGKNTTTDIKLYKINENSYIADTPGFSTFEITEIESNELFKYFKEFKIEEQNCEFVGCTHIKEENCGIKKALEEGKISNERYERFCKIYHELKEMEARKW